MVLNVGFESSSSHFFWGCVIDLIVCLVRFKAVIEKLAWFLAIRREKNVSKTITKQAINRMLNRLMLF